MSLIRGTRLTARLSPLRALSTFAYQISQYGEPTTALSRHNLSTPPSATGDDLIVNWLAAGVDPVDLAALRGDPVAAAFAHSSLPAVPGNEGVALVQHAGPDVASIKSGDFVIPIKVCHLALFFFCSLCTNSARALRCIVDENYMRVSNAVSQTCTSLSSTLQTSLGTWRESGTVNESQVIRVPNTMRLELAATLSASPFTALRLLSDYGSLSPGDVVVLNNASSAVGTAVVQIANALNLKTISLVHEASADYAPTVERLKLMGGDVVVEESLAASDALDLVLSDMPTPKLGLNGGDADSCALLARLVGKGGTVVTYCPGVSSDSAITPRGLAAESFSLPSWLESNDRSDVEAMVAQLTNMIEEGKLTAWLQRVKFSDLPAAIHVGGMTQRKLVALMPAAESL